MRILRLIWPAALALFATCAPALANTTAVGPSPAVAEPNGTHAVLALVRRRLPVHLHSTFVFTLDPSLAPNASAVDAFVVAQAPHGKVAVRGASTSALTRGLLTYLRTLGGDIYWSSDTFSSLPHTLPPLRAPLSGMSWAEHRYFINQVTYSYSLAFASWADWDYLLDWAALHGITLPLAVGGQEYVWRAVYRDFGLADADIYEWFSGPAFESWQRMGNIHGSWGPAGTRAAVTAHWIDAQWTLQRQIVNRMVALGMTPVLPGFAGFIPPALHARLGGPDLLVASEWAGIPSAFSNNTALDPTWPAFKTVQDAFLAKQFALYGNWTSHMYSVDLFNELAPSSLALDYLTNNTRSVVDSLRTTDPEAVWVMQAWLFISASYWNSSTIAALLSGAQRDEMLILDLYSEAWPAWNETANYFEHRWIWNLLHNFGGNQGLYGALTHYASEPLRARSLANGTLAGLGLAMEGMYQNEIVYELTLDVPWQTSVIDVEQWLSKWVARRYGSQPSAPGAHLVQQAWATLAASAYNITNPAVPAVTKSVLELVPAPAGLTNVTGPPHPTLLGYDPAAPAHALAALLGAAEQQPELLARAAFRYDLVDVARQVGANLFVPLYHDLISVWNASGTNASVVRAAGARMSALLHDIDTILATDENFLTSSWISKAKSWSNGTAVDAAFLEFDARDQISVWGPASGVPWSLDRYASKQWAGVVRELYVPTWAAFSEYLAAHPPEQYNATEWQLSLLALEREWETQTWGAARDEHWGTVGAPGDAVQVFWAKWRRVAEDYWGMLPTGSV